MLKRRDFIKQSVALAALPPVLLENGAAATNPQRAIDFVLMDARYADSHAFAQALQRRGARVIDTATDLGALWYGELGAAWTAAPLRLAGLTPHSDLFVCEGFARGHGARVVYQGSHDCRGVATLTHRLAPTAPLAGLAAALADAGPRWPLRLADRLGRAGRDDRPQGREQVATRTPRAPDHPGTLFSWLIA
jgi:hypothetical protein